MLKIISFVDWPTTFISTTYGWGLEGLCNYLNCEIKLYSYDQLRNRQIDGDYDNVLVIFEIGMPQHSGISAAELRSWFPNGKLIALCSDTCYYQANNLSPQLEPKDIDLHLELMPQCVEWLKERGANVDLFHWGLSERLINLATIFRQKLVGIWFNYDIKKIDFIGCYGPWTIENPDCWRHHAVKYLIENGYTFTQGGGSGHQDNDLFRLFKHYMAGWFTLGTTSHNRPELTRMGCVKFFRDDLGPILHSLLIYDNHPTIVNKYKDIVPYYDYDDFSSITKLCSLKKSDEYENLLNQQKNWVMEHSFEKEIITKLLKYKIISLGDFKK